jgi:uncharacterized membrane protein
MEINYKDLAEVKTEIAIIKEKQKIINNRIDELISYNNQISDNLNEYNRKKINPKKTGFVVRSSAILVSLFLFTFVVIISMG